MRKNERKLESFKRRLGTEFSQGNKLKVGELRYLMLRDYIRHEDSLINHRLTWLLVSEGLIFSAYGAIKEIIIELYLKSDIPEPLWNHIAALVKVESVLKYSGLSIAIAGFIGILAAYLSIRKIDSLYRDEVSSITTVPDLTGGGDPWAQRLGGFTPLAIPMILILAWVVILWPTKG